MRRSRPSPAPLVRAAPFALPALAVILAACSAPAPPPPPVQPVAPVPTAAPVVAPVALTPAQIAARATPAVVAIRSPRSLGTGFVVRKDGWIATNLHVIAGASELRVATPDRHEYPVIDVLAVDEARDLALVRIDAKDMGVVVLGDSDSVRAGDAVVAIGHPLGFVDTVSNGLVSAVRAVDPGLTLLQISAPIAPGSSGGPLFSDRGEVIGVATALINEGQNLNFGVPIRYLKALLDNTHPIPLAAFAAATAPRPSNLPSVTRDVPHHELAFLAGCTEADLEHALHIVQEAIEVGAPVYNQHHFAACYHIYEGAALDLEKRVPASCPGPRKAMRDGRTRAQKLDEPSAQAWAMRDAFDGLTAVIMRKLRGP
jgi:serine protease Do